MVNMTFVPKIIFDICKRFFQLGHFTFDQGQDDFSIEAAANPNLIDSTTDSTININFELDTTKKLKKGSTRLTRDTITRKGATIIVPEMIKMYVPKISSPVNARF